MSLTLSFAWRNRVTQADMLVEYGADSIAPEEGQQVMVEWRWRADPDDDWGEPRYTPVSYPATEAVYIPPGDGWVQINCYSIRDGITSWQQHVGEFEVEGSGTPVTYETFNVTDNGGEPLAVSEGDFMVKETP